MINGKRTCYWLMALSISALLSACSAADNPSPAPKDNFATIRVMTFNIEWGGDNVDFSKVVEAIQVSGADIVGIQEAEGNLQRLADDLGWHYNLRNYAVSKFPLIEPPNADGRYVLVEVSPGWAVALANVHLPSDPYGPDAIRDSASLGEIIEMERTVRLPKIEPGLQELSAMAVKGTPVFITGDFNAPSHADWTESMVDARPFMPFSVDWPVSVAVTAAGFKDAWRTVHDDPRTNPGLTWWAGRPPLPTYAPDDNDPQDRIDFIWFAGPADITSSEIVGEDGADGVSFSVNPWPSDHRAVVSQFDVVAAEVPALISTSQRVYRLGEDVDVVYRNLGDTSIEVLRIDGEQETILLSHKTENRIGFIRIPTDKVTAGRFVVRAQNDDGQMMTKEFWVLDPSLSPMVAVAGSTLSVGQGIQITWQNAPGNRNDYLAVFRADNPADSDTAVAWSYVHAAPSGQLILDESNGEWGWPLTPGKYVVRLMKDDGYDSLAESAEFSVE